MKKSTKMCIYSLDTSADEKVIATCSLDSGGVVCTGSEAVVQNLTKFGVFSDSKQRHVFPSDGQDFLDALPGHFQSGYMTAGPC